MFLSEFAIYIGEENAQGFCGFVTQANFFLFFEDSSLTKEKGHELITVIKKELSEQPLKDLSSVEDYLRNTIAKYNLSAGINLACGYLKDEIFYLKTKGDGLIAVSRDGRTNTIIEGDQTASGFVKSEDIYVFTAHNFWERVLAVNESSGILGENNPHTIVEQLTPYIKAESDQGMIAIFTKIKQKEDLENQVKAIRERPIWSRLSSWRQKYQTLGKRRTITLSVIVIIFFIFIWSVVFGYQRRLNDLNNKKIEATRSNISRELDLAGAQDSSNPVGALSLITQARSQVESLKKEVGPNYIKQINELVKLIDDKENAITRKEEKQGEEFFDLTIDSPNAKGDLLSLDSDSLGILDKSRGVIYILSLTKKSLDSQKINEIKRGKLIAVSQNNPVFFIPQEGVFTFQNGQVKKLIDQDKDWGNIADMTIYNGNIYLLDNGQSVIDKYIVTDNGYSPKIVYFKSQDVANLKDAHTMAIDSSVYVGLNNTVVKYTGGVVADFKANFPSALTFIDKVYANRDTTDVYVWEKQRGAIYILAKGGTYEKQIQSTLISQASDFVIFDNAIYLLQGAKILKISI